VKDIEDLVYARENRDGSFTFKVALIDATDYVKPGSELDAHALRIGSTIYTRNHSVPTLPAELAHDMLSFHPGQVRPAWVLEVKICPSFKEAQEMPVSRSRHYTVQYDVSRAYVKNHRNIDPLNVPALDSHSAFARCLASLAQVARIMRHSRASKPTPTRVDKPAPLAMIVAEIMIETKCLLSTFVGQRHGLPMIYRVHERPSMEVRERFHRALNTLRIPNTVDDLASPSQFAGILVSLEQRRDPKSQALLNDLLDTFLIRSLLSTNGEIGHFGLNVPRFGNWKPRDADGLTNQYQLLAATGQAQAMSAEEIAERVEKLNDKRWTRDERTFNAIFLESLLVRLALTDTVGTGTVHEVNEGRLSVMMNGFSKPASLQRVPKGLTLEPGEPIIAKLRGFNLRTKAYEFALLRRTSA
jgi:exoribonuclease II